MYNKVDLRGTGGKEREIAKLFPNLVRKSHPLYDFEDPITLQKFEIKKTGNKRLQSWIDALKYTDLTEEERSIVWRFVRFDTNTGECVEVFDTTLGEVVDRFICEDTKQLARKVGKLYPKRSQLQFKLNIYWR